MFNTTYMSPSHVSHTHSTTVIEKRAPTDESVKLLKEMEEAARAKVVETTVVSDNQFECVIHKSYDALSDCDFYQVTYSFNGTKRPLKIPVERYRNYKPEEVACMIRDKVAEDISNQMLKVAFMKMGR